MNRTWGTYLARTMGRRLGLTALLVSLLALTGCQQATENNGNGEENNTKKTPEEVQRIIASFDDPPTDPKNPTPKSKGPDPDWKPNEDLPLIPRNANGFVAIRVGELWRSPLLQNLRPKLPAPWFEPIQEHEQKLGLSMEDIDRVTAVFLGPPAGNKPPPTAYIISTRRAMDQQKLVEEYGQKGAKEVKLGKTKVTYYPLKDGLGVNFVSKFVAVIAPPGLLTRVPPLKPAPGPLEADVKETEDHTIVISLDAAAAMPGLAGELPPSLGAARQAKHVSVMINTTDSLAGKILLAFPNPNVAKGVAGVLKNAVPGLQQTATKMPLPINDLQKQSFIRSRMDAAFKGLQIDQEGSGVALRMQVSGDDLALIPEIFRSQINQVQDAAGRAAVINNLKRIALAMHQYELENGHLPPAAIYGKDGKALLSWRVAILPQLGEADLYKEFKLDEPWDSAHNKALLDRMPKIYELPNQEKPGTTHLRAFSGPATVFDGQKGLGFADIKDGTERTFAVVEAGESVPWTKPLDMPYELGKPLPPLGKMEPGAFLGLFLNGRVRSIPLEESRIRAYISRQGKEAIND
ncbi:MAG: DUF1559 domain-containing protein [Gemmataceae bacterium]